MKSERVKNSPHSPTTVQPKPRGQNIDVAISANGSSTVRKTAFPNFSTTTMRSAKSNFDLSRSKEFNLQELAMLSITPIVRSIHRWWLQRAERHYLICADVEQQRAREAQMNAAYYQKRAALARSAQN